MSKTKVELQLAELIRIGKEWSDFARGSYDAQGWDYRRETTALVVKCYFAGNSNHTAIEFKCGSTFVKIAFFEPVQIELEMASFPKLFVIINEAKLLLDSSRVQRENETTAELIANRTAARDNLLRKLKELEAEDS